MRLIDRVKRFGSSFYFRIPKKIAKNFNIDEYSYVEVDFKVIEQQNE